MKKYSVLFVCTGNICRSPTAEGVFRHQVAKQGLEELFQADSAGTHGYHVGEPPDARAIAAAQARGVRLDDLRARKFRPADFTDFDLILAMDEGHYGILKGLAPVKGRGGLSLFMDFAPDAGRRDVPDPYYGGSKDFAHVLDLVEQGVDGLLAHLRQESET